jgi:hypothetical protein
MSMVWVVIYWQYLGKPHVKAFLGVAQPEPTLQPQPAIQEVPNVPKEKISVAEPKFYCRYCGAENKKDAIFCEKCGRNIE